MGTMFCPEHGQDEEVVEEYDDSTLDALGAERGYRIYRLACDIEVSYPKSR